MSTKVTTLIDLDEIAIAEAALTLALRRKIILRVDEEQRPATLHELIIGFLRAHGPKSKREIKNYLIDHGYAETGAGPTCTQLKRQGRIQQNKGYNGLYYV